MQVVGEHIRMTPVALYLRQSLDSTGEEAAITRQRAACEALADARGWRVTASYEDNDLSSKKGVFRPSYARLVDDIRKGRVSVIVCYDLDRLTRVPAELEELIDLAEKGALRVVTANGEADLGTDAGRMFARIKAAVARSEVERKGKRHRDANEQRAMSGRVYGRKLSFGWADKECLHLEPAEAAEIAAAAKAVISGSSLNEIAADWNARGVRKPSGGQWTYSTVNSLLQRQINAGIVTYKGQEFRDVKPLWTPIIDVATYDAMRAALAGRSRFADPKRPKTRKHLMGGFARCSNCKTAFTGYTNAARGFRYVCGGGFMGCYRTIKGVELEQYALRRTAVSLLLDSGFGDLPEPNVQRLAEIGNEQKQITADRDEVAALKIGVSSKAALLADLDAREEALNEEAAELTRDSALAALRHDLIADTGEDIETIVDAAAEAVDRVIARIERLTLRQQRTLLSAGPTFWVHAGDAPHRITVG